MRDGRKWLALAFFICVFGALLATSRQDYPWAAVFGLIGDTSGALWLATKLLGQSDNRRYR